MKRMLLQIFLRIVESTCNQAQHRFPALRLKTRQEVVQPSSDSAKRICRRRDKQQTAVLSQIEDLLTSTPLNLGKLQCSSLTDPLIHPNHIGIDRRCKIIPSKQHVSLNEHTVAAMPGAHGHQMKVARRQEFEHVVEAWSALI